MGINASNPLGANTTQGTKVDIRHYKSIPLRSRWLLATVTSGEKQATSIFSQLTERIRTRGCLHPCSGFGVFDSLGHVQVLPLRY